MSPKRGGIAIKVFTPEGDCVLGQLNWNATGPYLTTYERGEPFSGDIAYEVDSEILADETGVSKRIPLKKAARIIMEPLMVTKRPYSAKVEKKSDDLYPPASHGWTSSWARGGQDRACPHQ